MTIRVGVVGVGTIGLEHVRRLAQRVSGAEVVALTDADPVRAVTVAGEALGARVFSTGQELVQDRSVEAVVVAGTRAAGEDSMEDEAEARAVPVLHLRSPQRELSPRRDAAA